MASFYSRLGIRCISPPNSQVSPERSQNGDGSRAVGTGAENGGNPCSKGCYYYTLNWFKVALAQLFFDLSVASVIWADIDIVFRGPFLRQYFAPTSRLIQVEC